jgi:hypothetical protein
VTALLAMMLGLAAIGYAAWPWLVRGGAVPPLDEAVPAFDPALETQLAALRAWSVAAGELAGTAANADPSTTRRKASE